MKKILNLFIYIITIQCFAVEREEVFKVMPQLEQLILKGMAEYKVPGLALAIVLNNEALILKGYGIREVDHPEVVDTQTVFQLASVSKPITSTILASLVEKGQADWDTKISDLNPSFRLPDPWVTSELTLRDLLSHRSGLPDHAGDLLEDLGFPRGTILERLRYIEKMGAFRSDYAYTNFGYSEAAFALAKKPWELVAREELFSPLGMNSSSYSYQDFLKRTNKATLHRIIDNKAVASSRNPDAQAPAGGASASISDVAKWMLFLLSKEPPKALLETQLPIIAANPGQAYFYGMGWGISYDPHKQLKHSGGFVSGARTYVLVIPDLNLGIAILDNASSNALPESLAQSLLDLLLKGALQKDYLTEYQKKWMEYEEQPLKVMNPPAGSSPSLPLEKYTGSFRNAFYGPIEIKQTSQGLVLIINTKHFPLRHFDRDVFILHTEGENQTGDTPVIFTMDGKVRSITIDAWNVVFRP